MRRIFYIHALFIGLSTLFTSSLYAYNTDKEREEALLSLIEKEVIYDDKCPIDSIISWSERILTPQKATADTEDYFNLELQLIYSYILQGDICLATDRAHRMYEEAQELKSELGLIFFMRAVGDIHAYTGMKEKSIEYYQQAVNRALFLNDEVSRGRTLPRLITARLQVGRTDEARQTLDQLKAIIEKTPRHPLSFLYAINETAYHICIGKLKEAHLFLQKADSIRQSRQEPFEQYVINYMKATEYRANGASDKALNLFNQVFRNSPNFPNFMEYRNISTEKIYLNKKFGNYHEAAQTYKELYASMDSIIRQSYHRQVKTVELSCLPKKLELENKQAYNRLVLYILLLITAILLLIIWIALRLKRQEKRVKQSKEALEQLRRKAENATRTKSVFLSNMSHEIRTPLNALSGFSSLLTESSLDEDTQKQCNEIIQQNSELLLKLINDVIDLSNLKVEDMQFNITTHEVIALCKNVVSTISKVKQTQAEVLFTSSLTSYSIETDEARLQQVLINLLINATKFTPQGSITLEVEKYSDEYLLFSITDTGCGIPPEKQANIFKRFEKLDENIQGSGLGLSICQLIIEHIGGKIWIDPQYTAGARFLFTHPITNNRPTSASRKEDKQA